MEQIGSPLKLVSVQNSIPETCQTTPESDDCPVCKGVRWVQRGNGVIRCECQKRRIAEDKIREVISRWPEYKNADFIGFKAKTVGQENALTVFRQNPKGSYFLTGLYSRGKTHMLICQYRYMALSGDRCLLRSAREVVEELRRAEAPADNGREVFESPILQMVNTARSGHLFIDDIDKAPARTGFRVEMLFDLFDTIKRRQLGVTVTSNLPLVGDKGKDLRSVLSDQVVARIHQVCRVIEL